jgi:hypothetical protein
MMMGRPVLYRKKIRKNLSELLMMRPNADVFVCVHAFKLPLYGTDYHNGYRRCELSGIWDEEWVGIGSKRRGGSLYPIINNDPIFHRRR